MTSQERNDETQSDFKKRMDDTVNSALVMTGLGLGDKLGFFKALADTDEPMTSTHLADKTNCKERYVREWLYHMVMCDIIDVDVTGKLFTLPAHRRQSLTGDEEPVTLRGSYISYMLITHLEILNCFRKDGPMGISLQSILPAFEESSGLHVSRPYSLFADMLKQSLPDLVDKLDSGMRVLDVGCGFGNLLFHFASLFPKSNFVGIDITPEVIQTAEAEKTAKHIQNTEFHVQDAGELPVTWYDSFDYVIIRDVLHDLPYPEKTLAMMNKCLKPGGFASVIELDLCQNPYDSYRNPKQKANGVFIYTTSIYHCLATSMYHPGSAGIGAGPGFEFITDLVKNANFTVASEPIPFADWNVHMLFQK